MINLVGLIPENILSLNSIEFKLLGVAGEGGSSIVYLAQPVNDTSSGYVMIKEFYPRGCGVERVVDGEKIGSLRVDSKHEERFKKLKNRVFQESNITNILLNDRSENIDGTEHADYSASNNPWQLEYCSPIEVNNTIYTIINTKSGETLKSLINRKFLKNKDFIYICDLMINILDALEHIHSKGYIHLDIAPDNIFIPKYKTDFDEITHIHILDYNSALKIGSQPEDWISSYKEGYTAPELYDNINPCDLNTTSDLYSVASIFFELLVGRRLKKTDRGSFSSWKLTRSSDFIKGFPNLLIAALNKLLLKGIEKSGNLRFQSAAEMRNEIKRLKALSNRKIMSDTKRFNPAYGHYTGMTNYLEQIDNVFSTSNHVYIEGIGGVGKTELAKKYAEVNRKKFDIIQLISYDANLASTIGRNLNFHNYDEDVYAKEYNDTLKNAMLSDDIIADKVNIKLLTDKLSFLEEHKERILIIIDNFNVDYDEDLHRFISSNHKIIFTSRVEHKSNSVIVNGIDENDVMALFESYYGKKVSIDDVPYVYEIGKRALGHTMTIELAAAALYMNGESIKSMLERLKIGITKIGAYAEIDKEEVNARDRQQTISEHISKLFDVSDIFINTNYNFIMTNLSIIPTEGIYVGAFYNWALSTFYSNNKDEAKKDLYNLRKQRWLQINLDENTGNKIISLHPTIAEISFDYLKPNSKECIGLLTGYIDEAKEYMRKSYIEKTNLIKLLSYACDKIEDEEIMVSELYNSTAILYNSLSWYDEAVRMYQKVYGIRERFYGIYDLRTINTVNNIACVFSRIGDYSNALELHESVLDVRERILGYEHPDTAASYNNIASIYSKIGEYDRAIELFVKDLSICEAILGDEHPDTATTYNNLAGVYYKKGDNEKAIELYSKALDIRKKVLGNHPDTATTYNDLALVYSNLGEFDIALDLYAKDFAITIDALGPEHPTVAINYSNIGLVHYYQNDYDKALEWFDKSLIIREKTLGTDHPETVALYKFIAMIYDKLGESLKYQEYMMKANLCN